jgi:hypothetical protein
MSEETGTTGDQSAFAIQVGGDHYKQYPIQPIQYARKNNLDAMQFSVVKYVTRHKQKNGVQDIRKAIHFLQMIAEYDYGVKVPIDYAELDQAEKLPKASQPETDTGAGDDDSRLN